MSTHDTSLDEPRMAPAVDATFLAQISIFSTLKEADLAKLASYWRPVAKEAGQLIFKKGDPGFAMYVVKEGSVAISVWTIDNREAVLSILGEGDFFGELALFDGLPRTANAKAAERTVLLEMTREDFLAFLRSRPEVALTMMRVIAERLRATNEMMERSTARNVNTEIEQTMSFGDRTADRIAQMVGSWGFIIFFVTFLILWIALNTVQLLFQALDPFPYILLNLMLSCIAALQAPVIMMSQNRQSEKDRVRSELDYQVNLKAEMQIQSLHVKIDEMRASEIQELRDQIALLHQQVTDVKNNGAGK